MADPAAELQRQLQLLAKQFRQRLQRELPELSRQANALDKADNESARLPLLLAIRQQLHKLCLLYTSPSPRDATLSRMPSSA